ncbi:hypothetical protein ACWIUD_11065 [Helicobacter sp. 23-1044]
MISKSALKNYDFIITLGFYSPALLSKCNVCFYPFLDCEADLYVRYEVGTEEGVVALLLYEFADISADSKLREFINALDYGYLSAESNVSEEELSEIKNQIRTHKKPLLLVGDDISHHAQKSNILNMLSALKSHSNLEVICAENLPSDFVLNLPTNLPEYNGCVIFVAQDSNAVSRESSADSKQDSHESNTNPTLKISREFARAWGLSDLQEIRFALDSQEICATCKIDKDFGGVIGVFGGAESKSYPFKTIAIQRH